MKVKGLGGLRFRSWAIILTTAVGLLCVAAWITTTVWAQGRGGWNTPGVSLTLSDYSYGRAEAYVSVYKASDSVDCGTLTAGNGVESASQTCGTGGGFQQLHYELTVYDSTGAEAGFCGGWSDLPIFIRCSPVMRRPDGGSSEAYVYLQAH